MQGQTITYFYNAARRMHAHDYLQQLIEQTCHKTARIADISLCTREPSEYKDIIFSFTKESDNKEIMLKQKLSKVTVSWKNLQETKTFLSIWVPPAPDLPS